eukprot:scaffold3597_cov395-Prasinococcus_capsulatus_cf.AAC.10
MAEAMHRLLEGVDLQAVFNDRLQPDNGRLCARRGMTSPPRTRPGDCQPTNSSSRGPRARSVPSRLMAAFHPHYPKTRQQWPCCWRQTLTSRSSQPRMAGPLRT